MIRYFNRNEINFNHNESILNPISCFIAEEANGLFELEAEFAKNVVIIEGDIIKAPSPRGEQLFRIYRIKKSLKGKMAYARHIFYDLSKNFLINVEINNVSGYTAIQSVLDNCESSHNFIGTSDILTQNSGIYKRINPVQAIIGDENSILNLYGGNLIRNNLNINIKSVGIDRGYEIRMGKNLIGIDADIDESNVKTRMYPTVVLGDNDTVYSLPEKYVDSPLINHYGEPIIYAVEIPLTDDQKQLYADDQLSMGDIYDIMRDYCNELYEMDNIDKPVINYKVDFVELSKTEQYKDLAILEQLDLYDIVTVNVSHLDINVKARVIKYKYDCLKDRYEKIELGDFSSVSSYTTDRIVSQINNRIKANESAVEYATNVITGNKGGYLITRRYPDGKPYELLVMDTEDINTASNVFRLNNSGLGFSQHGYNGPFGTALTIDGHIVADYMDTGTLTSILLKSSNYVSNVSGTKINLADGTIDTKNFKVDSSGNGTFAGQITGGTMNINNRFIVDAFGNMTASNGNFSGNITGSNISGSTFTQTGTHGTVSISDGILNGSSVYVNSLTAYDGISVDNNSIVLTNGDVGCNTINGGTPITSNNIGSQTIGYATNANYASSAGTSAVAQYAVSAGTAENVTSATNATYALALNSGGAGRGYVYVSAEYNFRPTIDGLSSCGSSQSKWTDIYSYNGTIVTSDERKKYDIKSPDDRFIKFANMIVPRMFKLVKGTRGRDHLGFSAQEIEQVMIECDISDMEFAGLIKSPVYDRYIKDDDGNDTTDYDTTSNIIDYDYGLRYEEFIPLCLIYSSQLNEKLQMQADKLRELEERISKLEVA